MRTPKETASFVLDTSALICLKSDERGASEVSKVLEDVSGSHRVFCSFMSPMEFFYSIYRERGREAAFRACVELKALPIQIIESDESLRMIAGEIKAQHRLSVADAWIAATAQYLGAVLVHKDPEFESLSSRIKLHPLPYKTG